MDPRLEAYRDNQKWVTELIVAQGLKKDMADRQHRHIKYDVYEEKIRKLEAERDAEIDKLENSLKAELGKLKAEEEQCYLVIKDVQLTFKMMELFERGFDPQELRYYQYTDKDDQGNYIGTRVRKIYGDPVQVMASDKYKHVAVFLVENGKPVNKWSLVAAGRSVFAELLQNLRGFGSSSGISNFEPSADRIAVLREGPSREKLLAWYEKQGRYPEHLCQAGKAMLEWLQAHIKLQDCFEEAVRLYGTREWRLAFLDHRKHYYEHSYSNGTQTDEYKAVLEEIRIFQTTRKELPLLLGTTTQPKAQAVLAELLKGA